ncbi:hypothetical protein ACRDNQ_07245 [Palleronia sp. KMU-117]|uniref:hypothetical protein n=1 Tax=Palleronia sp. KMU-117 TaxID=3434108 RepID=UPI003D714472
MIPPLFAIFTWPVVVIFLFVKLRPAEALIWSLLGGYLLLPEKANFDLPMLPALNKAVVPALATMVAVTIAMRRQQDRTPDLFLPGWLPRLWPVNLCLAGIFVGVVGTVLTNADAIQVGSLTLPGLRPYDALSGLLGTALALVPLLLGRRFLGHPDVHRILLAALVIAGVGYSLLALYEIRMSPQLHLKVYGYFQHSWVQHVRGDGFRPVVFLNHALWLALFLSGAILASLVLFRDSAGTTRVKYLLAACWVLLVLIMAKSLGSLAVTIILAPVILFLGPRLQLTVAAAIAAIILTYPMLRGADLVPVDRVMGLAQSIDASRAASLLTRLVNEDQLLEKASNRPLFGWGSWGRNRIFDDETGRNLSLTDGLWVIKVGSNGWVGYLGEFGLLTLGTLLLWWRSRQYEITIATAGLAVVLAGNLIDLIPNAGLTPLTWMIAGALIGRVEHGRIVEKAKASWTADDMQVVRYSRFGPESASGPISNGRPTHDYARNLQTLPNGREDPVS